MSIYLSQFDPQTLFETIVKQARTVKQQQTDQKKSGPAIHDLVNLQLKKQIVRFAKAESEDYGQKFKAFCQCKTSVNTKHILQNKVPSTRNIEKLNAKPQEQTCDHKICLKMIQNHFTNPPPQLDYPKTDFICNFESSNMEMKKGKTLVPPLSISKVTAIESMTVPQMQSQKSQGAVKSVKLRSAKSLTPLAHTKSNEQLVAAEKIQLNHSGFYWLMKNLIGPISQINSCPVNFPETVFFVNGIASEVIRTDQDTGFLQSIKNESKLTPEQIRTLFVTAVRERRKFVNRQKFKLNSVQNDEEQRPFEERTFAHADMVIIRHYYDPASGPSALYQKPYERIVNEAEFHRFLDNIKQDGKSDQQSLECIQTTVKSKFGLGRLIPVNFRVQLNSDEEKEIAYELGDQHSILHQHPPIVKYQYQKIGQEYAQTLGEVQLSPNEVEARVEQWLSDNAPEDYCLRQVLKMCHYMSVIRNFEILKMRADFYVDQNDKIWFFYASDIIWRPKKQGMFEIQKRETIRKTILEQKQKQQQKAFAMQQKLKMENKLRNENIDKKAEIIDEEQYKRLQRRTSYQRPRDQIRFAAKRPPTLSELQIQYSKKINEKFQSHFDTTQTQVNQNNSVGLIFSAPNSPLSFQDDIKSRQTSELDNSQILMYPQPWSPSSYLKKKDHSRTIAAWTLNPQMITAQKVTSIKTMSKPTNLSTSFVSSGSLISNTFLHRKMETTNSPKHFKMLGGPALSDDSTVAVQSLFNKFSVRPVTQGTPAPQRTNLR